MRRIILVLLLAIAACQPLPHPFADDDGLPPSPALSPPDSAGILVLPVSGAPENASRALEAAMAEALRAAEIPASTTAGNRASYRLPAAALEQARAGGQVAIAVTWELRGPGGTVVGRSNGQAVAASDELWQGGDAALAGTIVAQAIPGLQRLIAGNVPRAAEGADPVVAVGAVEGAPGDGGEALPRAMGNALRRANLRLAGEAGAAANFTVTGKVEVAPAGPGQQQVKLHWRLSGANGAEIGQIDQENAVAAGSLEPFWGDIAYAAASAAAPGIVQLIEQVHLQPSGG